MLRRLARVWGSRVDIVGVSYRIGHGRTTVSSRGAINRRDGINSSWSCCLAKVWIPESMSEKVIHQNVLIVFSPKSRSQCSDFVVWKVSRNMAEVIVGRQEVMTSHTIDKWQLWEAIYNMWKAFYQGSDESQLHIGVHSKELCKTCH